jgi:hypothetical protein
VPASSGDIDVLTRLAQRVRVSLSLASASPLLLVRRGVASRFTVDPSDAS